MISITYTAGDVVQSTGQQLVNQDLYQGKGAIQYTGQPLRGQYLHQGESLQHTGPKLRYWINIHSSQLRCGRVILYPRVISQRVFTNYLCIVHLARLGLAMWMSASSTSQ